MKIRSGQFILLLLLVLSVQAQESIKVFNIVTIGDSNGALKDGWVEQLKKLMPGSSFLNNSQSGRTIGFDNLGRSELNALSNIDRWLDEALAGSAGEKPDYLIICLGTNDAKKDFSARAGEVPENLNILLKKIRNHPFIRESKPVLICVSPPPMRDENMETKYQGANERLARFIPEFRRIAKKNRFCFVDIYNPLLTVFESHAPDGVHMNAEGQMIVAKMILKSVISNQ